MTLKKGSQIYFMGIAGTGMAAVAGLLQEAGYDVLGSDKEIYPPMSTMLEKLGIQVITPYAAKNLDGRSPDRVVIANVLSRGHEELEEALKRGLPKTSFPEILGEAILHERTNIVVSGTHGKTTTSSLTAHILNELGEDPGYFIGGIPRNFKTGFSLGEGNLFVLEGDEYDTVYFDKESKFLHYKPSYVILNNLEFDHADIFDDLEAMEKMFHKLISLVGNKSKIIANVSDKGIKKLINDAEISSQVQLIDSEGDSEKNCAIKHTKSTPLPNGNWLASFQTREWGTLDVESILTGSHNISNIAQILGLLQTLSENGDLKNKVSSDKLKSAFLSFKGIKRRLDLLADKDGISVFEDFAHHPTAVSKVIDGFKKTHPDKRLLVAFEPRNASSRRNVFQNQYKKSLGQADKVFIGYCPVDLRIPEDERMDTQDIATGIGSKATSFSSNEDLLSAIQNEMQSGDAVIFMSSGSFSGVQHKLAESLRP